jgi:hypothetical protein
VAARDGMSKMATKSDLKKWIFEALRDLGGEAKLIEVAEHIWKHHEPELAINRSLFFTWQYDMRWAAQELRKAGVMKPATKDNVWRLA